MRREKKISWSLEDEKKILMTNISSTPMGSAGRGATTTVSAGGTAIYGMPSVSVANAAPMAKRRFCQKCGNPIVTGKIVRKEHCAQTGVMTYKWDVIGCLKYKFLLRHPGLLKWYCKLMRRFPKFEHDFTIARYAYDWPSRGWSFESHQSLFRWWRWSEWA